MKKIAIFNVGGALSTYIECDDKKFIADLGSSSDFSPVDDFLVPLAKKRPFNKYGSTEKYLIDQLFISHLDKDHISDYEKFRKQFHPDWMTCPNDNDKANQNGEKQDDKFKINPDLVGEENDMRNMVLDDMRERQPLSSDQPLGSKCEEIKLYFITPKECEENEELKPCYPNNISLVLFIILDKKTVLLPGDILKEGMEFLIDNHSDFKNDLNKVGIDFLIAPHHGLTTSFSERLFQEILGNKTRLNIISEKVREEDSDENRSEVDKRYYDSKYSTGENSLNQNGVKTSMGHIVIDLESDEKEIKQFTDIEDVMKEFTT
ncbi:MAG: hypothetical protein RBS77_05325 [Candidatus Moranbacteria bacterium]|jgi:beta-lactamase superfamily II metal-dependent hydrolase|nr:hypothetical protein [Candidatus Moranbacteria bacterium]